MPRKKESFTTGGPSVDPTRHNAPYYCRWREIVSDGGGSREVTRTRWFPTLDQAREHGRAVTGVRAIRNFTDSERMMALHFFREAEIRNLDPFDVFSAGLRHYNAEMITTLPVAQAIDAYLTWMTGEKYSPKTIGDRRLNLEWMLRKSEPGRMVHEFTPDELVTMVRARYENPVSQSAFIRSLAAFFAWAAKQGYCQPSIAQQTKLGSQTRSSVRKSAQRRTHKRPPRLRADQIPILFAAIPTRYHPAMALAVFAGLRPDSELPRVQWRKMERNIYGIDLESRTIHMHESWVTKTYMERTLHDLPEALWQILEAHKPDGALDGVRVSGCNYTNWRKFVVDPAKKALHLTRWPTDYLRHTALSFMYATVGQEATVNNAGHTTTRTLFAHYNNAVGKAEADRFAALRYKEGEIT